jgi:hypothetical protein
LTASSTSEKEDGECNTSYVGSVTALKRTVGFRRVRWMNAKCWINGWKIGEAGQVHGRFFLAFARFFDSPDCTVDVERLWEGEISWSRGGCTYIDATLTMTTNKQ